MVWFVLSYMVQIGIAIYALTAIPMKGELPTVYENCRKNGMVAFGFLPCFVFSLLMQGIFAAVYFSKVAAVRSAESKAQAKFQGSLGHSAPPATSGNPFGGGTPSAAPPPPAGANPFGGTAAAPPPSATPNPFGGSAQPAPPAADNPFATGGSGGSTPPSDNPFA